MHRFAARPFVFWLLPVLGFLLVGATPVAAVDRSYASSHSTASTVSARPVSLGGGRVGVNDNNGWSSKTRYYTAYPHKSCPIRPIKVKVQFQVRANRTNLDIKNVRLTNTKLGKGRKTLMPSIKWNGRIKYIGVGQKWSLYERGYVRNFFTGTRYAQYNQRFDGKGRRYAMHRFTVVPSEDDLQAPICGAHFTMVFKRY